MQSSRLIKAYPVCAQFSDASVAESGNSRPEVMAPEVAPVLSPERTKQSSVVTEAASNHGAYPVPMRITPWDSSADV